MELNWKEQGIDFYLEERSNWQDMKVDGERLMIDERKTYVFKAEKETTWNGERYVEEYEIILQGNEFYWADVFDIERGKKTLERIDFHEFCVAIKNVLGDDFKITNQDKYSEELMWKNKGIKYIYNRKA